MRVVVILPYMHYLLEQFDIPSPFTCDLSLQGNLVMTVCNLLALVVSSVEFKLGKAL